MNKNDFFELENNQNKKENINKKNLYSCESILNGYEYKKMAKYFPKRMYWVFITRGIILNLIFSSILAIITKDIFVTLSFLVICQIFLMILYRVKLEYYSEKVFNRRKKINNIDTEFETKFYDDYFIRKGKFATFTIKYSDISKCIETDTNFYLEIPQKNTIVIFQKNRCDLDLINFIRRKFKIENHLGDEVKFNVKKHYDPKFIKYGMIVLFIVTILSFFAAIYTTLLIDEIYPRYGSDFNKNMWIFWCFIPIPILSIILGFKYKKAGFKCKKNIVSGFIIAFLLLIYGSFCLFPTFNVDYEEINKYKDVIDAKLPNNGVLEIQNIENYYEEDKTNYTIINAYFEKENVDEFLESIKKSENWILSNNLKSELKIFIPSHARSINDAYFSIYNKTTNQYNNLPEMPGKYEIYVMKYDESNKILEINKFNYLYK